MSIRKTKTITKEVYLQRAVPSQIKSIIERQGVVSNPELCEAIYGKKDSRSRNILAYHTTRLVQFGIIKVHHTIHEIGQQETKYWCLSEVKQ